jgi:hypothetical protein
MREQPEAKARRLLAEHPPYLAMRHAQERLHSHTPGTYSWRWWAAVCEALYPKVNRHKPPARPPQPRSTLYG